MNELNETGLYTSAGENVTIINHRILLVYHLLEEVLDIGISLIFGIAAPDYQLNEIFNFLFKILTI